MRRTVCAIGLLLGVAGPGVAWAGQTPAAVAVAASFAGPPPPAAPAVEARDEQGRVTIRAVRLDSPLRVDGSLDEAIYASTPSISDFIQIDPKEGGPPSEKTEVWIFYDRENFYVAFRAWESHPERRVANELRRDNTNNSQNDYVNFVLDTFYDRRNGMAFSITPLGGRMDGQVSNERQFNGDYNPVWTFRTGTFESGWTVECAIPFKSLRYRQGRSQVWGINIGRQIRWNNELLSLTRVPQSLGKSGTFQLSRAATIVGLEVPSGSRAIELKPYAISNLTVGSPGTELEFAL